MSFDFSCSEVRELQDICSLAEEKMEKFWSKKIMQSSDPQSALSNFIYYLNYKKLTTVEYHLLLSQLPSIKKVLFVGGGALPLSAILLAQEGVRSLLIERDPEAFMLSSQLIQTLGLENRIEIVQQDFLEFTSGEHFDVVRMASLLFTNNDADKLLAYLSNEVCFDMVLIRTVEGLRQLLYQKVPLNLVKKYFTLEFEVHPKNEILNSILLCSNKVNDDRE